MATPPSPYEQLAAGVFNPALLGSQLSGSIQPGQGIECSSLSSSASTLGYVTSTTTDTGWAYMNPIPASWGTQIIQQTKKMIKFFRVNEEVKIEEGGLLADPLDALRLKVARWLNKGEVLV